MIEYTITPTAYENSTLYVDLVKLDSECTQQSAILFFTPAELQEVLALSIVEEQKAYIRVKLLRFNEGFQQQWQREKDAKANTIPSSLWSLIGVAGTTKVTQAEIDALPSEEE